MITERQLFGEDGKMMRQNDIFRSSSFSNIILTIYFLSDFVNIKFLSI